MHVALRQAYQRARHINVDVSTGNPSPQPTPAPVVRFVPNVPFGQRKVIVKRKLSDLGLENLGFRRRAYDVEYERGWHRELCGNPPKSLALQGDRFKLRQIHEAVCESYQLNQNIFLSTRRQQSLVNARHLAMYLARYNTQCSLLELGRWLGGRDHTTILHGVRRIERMRLTDPDIAARIDLLSRRLGFMEARDVLA